MQAPDGNLQPIKHFDSITHEKTEKNKGKSVKQGEEESLEDKISSSAFTSIKETSNTQENKFQKNEKIPHKFHNSSKDLLAMDQSKFLDSMAEGLSGASLKNATKEINSYLREPDFVEVTEEEMDEKVAQHHQRMEGNQKRQPIAENAGANETKNLDVKNMREEEM